jgi:hypothetical protein
MVIEAHYILACDGVYSGIYQRFGGSTYLSLQGIRVEVDAAGSSVIVVLLYQSTRRCISEISTLRSPCRENLKSNRNYLVRVDSDECGWRDDVVGIERSRCRNSGGSICTEWKHLTLACSRQGMGSRYCSRSKWPQEVTTSPPSSLCVVCSWPIST